MSKFTVCLTHDVDRVFKSYQYITHDLLRLRFLNLGSVFRRQNPYWLFDRIMACEDKQGVRSTFFFLEESIPFKLFSPKNWVLSFGKYKFSDHPVADIISKLDVGGWEVGLHGSYNSYKYTTLLKKEKASLEAVLGKQVLGIRQHYLNLDIPDTWVRQKNAGFSYDVSYGLKNNIGFPQGTYLPFIEQNSKLLVIPLALMDGYLFGSARDEKDAWEKCIAIIDEAEQNCAVMVVLWHQRVFNEREFPGYREIYEKLIIECKLRDARFMLCREIIEQNDCYA